MTSSKRRGDVRLARLVVCLGVAFGGGGAGQTVRSTSVLVSHWKLDEGQRTTTADSTSVGTGTLRNGVAWTTGPLGGALILDGVDDYVSLPALEVESSAITLTAWAQSGMDLNAHRLEWRYPSQHLVSRSRNVRRVHDTPLSKRNRSGFPGRVRLCRPWQECSGLHWTESGRIELSARIGTDYSSPYSATWRRVEGGAYTLQAIAYDVAGASTTSATRNVTVSARALVPAPSPEAPPPNQPPSVWLTSPTSGATFTALASIPLSATANDPDGTIAIVEFYANNTLIATDTTQPPSIDTSWRSFPPARTRRSQIPSRRGTWESPRSRMVSAGPTSLPSSSRCRPEPTWQP